MYDSITGASELHTRERGVLGIIEVLVNNKDAWDNGASETPKAASTVNIAAQLFSRSNHINPYRTPDDYGQSYRKTLLLQS
ncbi:MAG: hypothetical protein LBJ67_12205 [Planctomycetaceae bacterium]|nr:hypothetical protein [Planctomycetaceae bacterium]